MSEEKELELTNEPKEINEAEQDFVSVSEIDAQEAAAVDTAEDFGIFSFLAYSPLFAVEKPVYRLPEKKFEKAAERPVIETTERGTGAVYDWIYYFGLQIIRRFRHLGSVIRSVLRRPVHAFAVFASLFYVFFDKIVMRSFHTAEEDIKKFIKDSRTEKKPKGSFFKTHPHLLKTAVNVSLPLASLALLIITVGYWTGSTYALEVVVDNNGEECSLGYISDESVFIEARTIVKDRIDSGASGQDEELIANPTYKITRVRLNQLSDADAISDKLIENSDSKLTNACGVYIDDEFICAVKNETDARSVFNSLLAEAEDKYKIDANDENSFADFVENVEFRQGLYSDDDSGMWEASKLLNTLENEKKSEAVYYTVRDGDTPSEIAQSYDISTSELMALNPNVNFNIFKTGTELMISSEVNFVRVKIIRVVEKNESTMYETEKVESDKLFRGDRRVIRKGVKGTDRVTYLVTYIDGVQTSTQEIDRVTLLEPTSERIQIGTKRPSTGYGGNYEIVSTGKMVWPVSGLYTITSYYGNRRSGWHTGLDISGGSASGKLVLAAESGTVELVKLSNRSYGNQVVINHGGGVKTRYAHMLDGSISVSVGQRVSRGQAIGRVGNTGNSSGAHLHFEVIVNGNCVNPYPYIK